MPLPGVFPQVDGADDPYGRNQHAHEQSHDESAEDGGEDAALRIGLPRIIHDEMIQAVEEDAAFAGESQVIRLVAVNDFIHADFFLFPVSQGIHKRVSSLLLPQSGCFRGVPGVFGVELFHFGAEPVQFPGRVVHIRENGVFPGDGRTPSVFFPDVVGTFYGLDIQFGICQPGIDGAYVPGVNGFDPVPQFRFPVQRTTESRHEFR